MSRVSSISLGENNTAAITNNGNLYIWGGNTDGQIGDGTTITRSEPVNVMSDIASVILSSNNTTIAITSKGDLYTWGDNYAGQLGDNTTADRYIPLKIMSNVVSACSSGYIAAAISSNGDLYTWGSGSSGRIGDGTNENKYKPTKVLTNVDSVILGSFIGAAVTRNGDLYAWGNNQNHQLGNNTGSTSYSPVKVMGNVNDFAIGAAHCAAVTEDGNLYVWGENTCGQLGNGVIMKKNGNPSKIMSNIKYSTTCSNGGAAIVDNGDLYIWGYGNSGRIGNGTTSGTYRPVKVLEHVVDVVLASDYTAAITENGDLYMWGENGFGQLGDGTTDDKYKPVKIMSNVASVTLNNRRTAAVTKNRELYMWGFNNSGNLGDGTRKSSSIPVKIMDNIATVKLEGTYSAAITTNGELYTWGDNFEGQLGNGTRGDSNDSEVPIKIMSDVTKVSLGVDYAAAIKKNGDLYTWGDNECGALGNGTTTDSCVPTKIMSNVIDVQLDTENYSSSHSAAITQNGDLYVWGSNQYGQLGDGTTEDKYKPEKIMSNVVTVNISKNRFNVVIMENGDLYNWGGINGAPNTPTKMLENVANVRSYSSSCIAISSSGDLYSWGYGSYDITLGKHWYDPGIINIPYERITYFNNTVENDSYNLKASSSSQAFTNLLPNEVYNIYSMNSRKADEPFSSDNLLYIDQKMSDSNGNLTAEINTDKNGIAPEIFVKAMNGGEISNAEITSLTQSDSSAAISWEAVEGADKYTVYTIRNGIFIKEADTNKLSYTVDGLIPETEYGFIVQAWVNGEYSVLDKSDAVYIIPVSENTGDETPKPKFTSVTPGVNSISLKWNAIEGATSYRVHYRLSGSGKWSYVNTKRTSLTLSNLTGGKKYDLLVRYSNGTALSSFTSADIVTATPLTAAVKPKFTSVTPGVNSISLKWNAIEGATSYRVHYRLSGSGKWSYVNTKRTSLTLSNLTGGKKYDLVVRYSNGTALSSFTSADIVTATPIAASSKPLIYSAVPGTNSVVLRWNAVSGAKSYRVYYRVSGTAKWSYKNTTRNAMNLTGLTGGKTYDFVVRAYNGSTWTAYSSADIVKATVKN